MTQRRQPRPAGGADRRRETGKLGETAAAALLESKGYRIVARNWRCRSGELDLVAEQSGTLVIVEVRTRRPTGTHGTAKEAVDARKQRQVRETAQFYLYATKQFDVKLRFDVIAVELPRHGEEAPRIEHIEHAF
jgi:putative endonuclease